MGANTMSAQERQQQAYQEQLRQIQLQREQKMREKMQQLKAEYLSAYSLPLNYPAKVTSITDDDGGSSNKSNDSIRTSSDFINARLLEAGLPMGGGQSPSKLTLGDHSVAVQRFINDLEGTGCYDSVQVHIGNDQDTRINNDDDVSPEQQQSAYEMFDVTVRLKEKRWYKIYIGGGVNSEDLSSLGTSGGMSSGNAFGGGAGIALGALPKLQFESSISASNLSGFADISTALYSVDQTGASSFKFTHDRPLCSWLPKHSSLYDWLMPQDPRLVGDESIEKEKTSDGIDEMQVFMNDDAQYALGGGSHISLGVHALCLEQDFEATRSSKEFTRSIGVRLANHCRGASRGPGIGGGNKPSTSPPETMAGPYFFLDWNACLRDTLPRRHSEFPFALDCSSEVAIQAGTAFKHSLTGGMYLNGSLTDDRYDPTMGYDAHLVGEVAGPPGDSGFWKLKGGGAFHFPLDLLRMMTMGIESNNDTEEETSESTVGMTLHSSVNFGIARSLTFNGLCSNVGGMPLSDRFYSGGPGQLRGFLPAGIGPRATNGGSSTPGGDSLGGDMFYTSTLAASIPFPSYFTTLRQNGGRLFGFANAGTCVTVDPSVGFGSLSAFSRIMNSSRVAIGGGVSMGTPMGRFELTYAVPMRYGPKDARKNVQMGFGFSFG
ncbi:hypothetical protein ACHAWT_008082 [Skeletonema menzelii]